MRRMALVTAGVAASFAGLGPIASAATTDGYVEVHEDAYCDEPTAGGYDGEDESYYGYDESQADESGYPVDDACDTEEEPGTPPDDRQPPAENPAENPATPRTGESEPVVQPVAATTPVPAAEPTAEPGDGATVEAAPALAETGLPAGAVAALGAASIVLGAASRRLARI